jgi:hypothetical protein
MIKSLGKQELCTGNDLMKEKNLRIHMAFMEQSQTRVVVIKMR